MSKCIVSTFVSFKIQISKTYKNIDFEFGFAYFFSAFTQKILPKEQTLQFIIKLISLDMRRVLKQPLVSCAPLTDLINYLFYLHQLLTKT